MKKIFLFSALLGIAACSHKKDIPETLQNKFDVHIISNNFSGSGIDLEINHLKEILVLLHDKFSDEEIKEYFKMNDSTYKININNLFGEGLIKKNEEGNFVPTCMVMDFENANQFKKTADSLGREMSLIVIDRLTKIKEAYKNISAFINISFENSSLFILGNVVYNYCQMPVIEEKFIKAEAPRRGINRYNLIISEKNRNSKSNPLDLYVNNFQSVGNYIAGCYGDESSKSDSIVTFAELKKILKNQKPGVPLIGKEDSKKLMNLAQIISPDVLGYLERNRTLFVKLYLSSVYKDQTTFREWFVWYYQFIISQTTRTLIEKGYIKKSLAQQNRFIFVK